MSTSMLVRLGLDRAVPHQRSDQIDQLVLHPVLGIAGAMAVAWALKQFTTRGQVRTLMMELNSLAGTLGCWLAVVFEPISFNWQICIALVPGLAAREVAVRVLRTGFALSAVGKDPSAALAPILVQQWSLATALSLPVWYVLAPMCLSTLSTIKRETGGWTMALVAGGYLTELADGASWITYRLALAAGG